MIHIYGNHGYIHDLCIHDVGFDDAYIFDACIHDASVHNSCILDASMYISMRRDTLRGGGGGGEEEEEGLLQGDTRSRM